MFAHAWSLHFPLQNQKTKREAWRFRYILGCIYSVPWANHVGIINPFHLKTKWLNMVPNAWLTKKGCFFGHLNLIITFSMHSMRIPESFISMKCCWSIDNQNCHSLGYGVEPSSCFYEKVNRVKLKYGSNHHAKKLGQKMDRVTSLLRLLPNTFKIVDVPVTSSFTLTEMSWTMLKI